MPPSPSIPLLKEALSAFATGLVIAATRDEKGVPCGLTMSAFTSVSLSPPLVLISMAHKTFSYQVFMTAPLFSINVLAAHQESLAQHFATTGEDKFSYGAWSNTPFTPPLLKDSLSWFQCAKEKAIPAGDHTLFLGRVLSCGTGTPHQDGPLVGNPSDDAALAYWRRHYLRLENHCAP